MHAPPVSVRALDAILADLERLPRTPVIAEATAWVKWHRLAAASPHRPPLVFGLGEPGAVAMGREGDVALFDDPGLSGIRYAWTIMAADPVRRARLRAAGIVRKPVRRPANALRNALAKAADWMERRCPDLAAAVRRISVSNDGGLRYNEVVGQRIFLR